MQAIRVGIYCRVSYDDHSDKDSTSIENQKLMLTDYCFERGWSIIDIYADDGYTGVNFERPEFKRLIADASSGKINLILVKDLSRFGRSHLECGYYQEDFLPSIGCRFVAVNDGIDTVNGGNDIMPFRNVYNEMYSQDMRRRVVTAKDVRAKEGKYMAAVAPFGYIKSDHSLEIDEFAAGIVRRIFDERESGMTCCSIAAQLNREGVITPREYFYKTRSRQDPRTKPSRWSDGGISRILKNETYTGTTVQFKTRKISLRHKGQVAQSREDWIRCENAHPAIISREQWERVQTMWSSTVLRSTADDKEKPLFTGLIKCLDCGSNMNRKPDGNRRKDGTCLNHHAYTCGGYKHGGTAVCTSHHILECVLVEIVQNDIRQYTKVIKRDEKRLLRKLKNEYCKRKKVCISSLENDLAALEERCEELDRLTEKLYEETLLGDIPREKLIELSNSYAGEKDTIKSRYAQLRAELLEYERKEDSISKWIAVLNEYMRADTLDSELLHRLVREIRVGETKNEDGHKTRVIEIDYNF